MPSAATLERFIAKVEANQHVAAIAEFYNVMTQHSDSAHDTAIIA